MPISRAGRMTVRSAPGPRSNRSRSPAAPSSSAAWRSFLGVFPIELANGIRGNGGVGAFVPFDLQRAAAFHGGPGIVGKHGDAVTNRDFTRTLGRVLSRPTLFPLPAFAARLAFGEMADALLLASQRVEPARLLGSGFSFSYPELGGALRHLLRQKG